MSKFFRTFLQPTIYNLQPILLNGQKGQSTMYIVIIIMVIIFAVTFAGGTSSLLSGGTASPVEDTPAPTETTPTPTIASTATPTTTPSPIPASQAGWSISINFLGCNINGYPGADINSVGTQNGYITIEIEENGSLRAVDTARFEAPTSVSPATLLNRIGFNTKAWRVRLFSGGALNNNQWSGGTFKAEANGAPTGC